MKVYKNTYIVEDSILGEGSYGKVQAARSLKDEKLKICVKIMKKKKHYGENVLRTV